MYQSQNSDVHKTSLAVKKIKIRVQFLLTSAKFVNMDLTTVISITEVLKKLQPDEIYNLAAQSSVSRSFSMPYNTYDFNIRSVYNLLEAIRIMDYDVRFYQASSSEMFGENCFLPINENSGLNPKSPYAITKAVAHWMVENYREVYGLFAVSGILFNHESVLRAPNFFVKKVIDASIAISRGKQDILEVGNVNIKRDFGYGPAYVEAIWKMLQIDSPKDFVICSGKSVFLKDIIFYIFHRLGIPQEKMVVNSQYVRPTDIYDIYGDNAKAKTHLNWNYDISFFNVLDILIDETFAMEGMI